MSIVAYTGLPGSGKTYAAVEHQILPGLKAGRIVITNIPLKADLIRNDIPKSDLGMPIDLRNFPLETVATQPELMAEVVPPGAILVLDEVWRLFPSGTKANQVPEQFRSFFAEHRHRVDAAGNSTQIVLVTQDLAQIGAFARQLVEQTFHVVKLSTLGIPSSTRFKVSMYAGPVAGPNPPINGRIREVFGRYKKTVYQYYTSHTQSEAGEGTGPNEKGMDERANVFKRPVLLMIPVIMAACVGVLWWKGGYLLDKYHKKPSGPSAPAPEAGGRPGAGSPQHGSSPSFFGGTLAHIEGAGAWRVIGILKNLSVPERSYALLADGKGPKVTVRLDRCEIVEGEPTRCKYDGFWYSESGRATVASSEGEPLKIWSQGAPKVTAVKPVEVQVLPPAHGDPTEGSEVLRMLSQNSAGVDSPHRTESTLRGVARP